MKRDLSGNTYVKINEKKSILNYECAELKNRVIFNKQAKRKNGREILHYLSNVVSDLAQSKELMKLENSKDDTFFMI